jgi:hypothetical protein
MMSPELIINKHPQLQKADGAALGQQQKRFNGKVYLKRKRV